MKIWKVLLVGLTLALPAGYAQAAWDCTAYGDFAMRDIAKAEAAQCGFSGPRWNADEGMHYGFCVERLGAGDDNAMTVETDARMRDVAGCEKKFGARVVCPDYAKRASQAVNEAADLGCDFGGPRWSTDEGLHFGYCTERTSAGDMDALTSESDARRADLAECKLAKAKDVETDDVVDGGQQPQTATANQPTAYYDEPGGNGNYLGDVNLNQKVAIVECRDDDWCQISGPDGWVWGPHLTR